LFTDAVRSSSFRGGPRVLQWSFGLFDDDDSIIMLRNFKEEEEEEEEEK